MLLLSLIFQVVLLNFSKIDARYVVRGFNASFDQDLDLNPYIVGGEDATIEEFPYQVILLYDKRFICGGSIIKPNIILTAAHCVYGLDIGQFAIRAGSSYSNKLSLGPTIKLIELQPANEVIPDRTTAVISGWGRRKSDMSQLQKAEVRKTNFASCKKTYQNDRYKVTARMTCYGLEEGGKGICKGDSGGPLVVNGKQAGIVSWIKGCAIAGYPGVYTDITNEEIQNHIFNSSALNEICILFVL